MVMDKNQTVSMYQRHEIVMINADKKGKGFFKLKLIHMENIQRCSDDMYIYYCYNIEQNAWYRNLDVKEEITLPTE